MVFCVPKTFQMCALSSVNLYSFQGLLLQLETTTLLLHRHHQGQPSHLWLDHTSSLAVQHQTKGLLSSFFFFSLQLTSTVFVSKEATAPLLKLFDLRRYANLRNTLCDIRSHTCTPQMLFVFVYDGTYTYCVYKPQKWNYHGCYQAVGYIDWTWVDGFWSWKTALSP